MEHPLTAPPPRPVITRRRVVSGLAWSAPAVAVVAPAPAFAGSGNPCDHRSLWQTFFSDNGITVDPSTGTFSEDAANGDAYPLDVTFTVTYLDGTDFSETLTLDPRANPATPTTGVLTLETAHLGPSIYDLSTFGHATAGASAPDSTSGFNAEFNAESCVIDTASEIVVRE